NAIFKEYVAEIGEVNATTGEGRWFTVQGAFGELRLLDTRGLSEGTRPEQATADSTADDIVAACKEEYPDAILFLVKAKEVDAHIHDDIHEVIAVRDRIAKLHSYSPPIIGVLAQVDELDPVDVSSPPYADANKTANIGRAEQTFREHLSSHGINTKVFSTSAYSRFEKGQLVSARHWQIEELLTYLAEQLPHDAQIAMARLGRIKTVQKRVANMVVQAATGLAGAVAITPLPVADLPLLTSIQIGMITGIGYISGRKMDKEASAEFLTAMGMNVGAAYVLREAARALVKFIFPVGGLVVSSAIAAGATYGMGQAATAYFIEGAPVGRAKELFQQATGNAATARDKVMEQFAVAKDKVMGTVSPIAGKVVDTVSPIAGKVMDTVSPIAGKVMDQVATGAGQVMDTVSTGKNKVMDQFGTDKDGSTTNDSRTHGDSFHR
ncbi:MAG: hypothetical protein JWN15_3220, partial [Firmicutes bacterium]|nr:hypothetical protein [Bacillota bacterium]